MKIISWNCNMAFRNKYEHVVAMDPDLLVIQECEHKQKLSDALADSGYNEIVWIGNNKHKGLGVITFNHCHVEQIEDYNDEFDYVLPLQLNNGAKKINLFAIWAMPHASVRSKDYVGQVWGAVNHYKDLLNESCILIGDLNSNAIWDKQRKNGNHTDVVNLLEKNNIVSVYHRQYQVEHGKEKDPTIYLLKNIKKPYHLDYCFASEELLGMNTKIDIGNPKDWLKLSDHMPLIIDGLDIS